MPRCRCRGLASLQPPSFPCTNEGHLMHAAKSCDSLLVKNSARNARGEFICCDWYLAPCVPPLPQYFWLLNLKTFARALSQLLKSTAPAQALSRITTLLHLFVPSPPPPFGEVEGRYTCSRSLRHQMNVHLFVSKNLNASLSSPRAAWKDDKEIRIPIFRAFSL